VLDTGSPPDDVSVAADDIADAGPGEFDDAQSALDDAGAIPDGAVELPDDTVELELDPSGLETGVVLTGDDGTARFWSAARGAHWEIALGDGAGEGVGEGVEVTVSVDAAGDGTYFIYDPSERYAPIVFSAPTPETGSHSLEIDAAEQLLDADVLVDFVPDPPNPFAFTVMGLSVSISIGAVMREVAWSAALGVFASLVTSACNSLLPVYDDICGIVGTTVGILGGLVRPGFVLAQSGFATGRAAAVELGKGLIGKIGEWGCGQGGKMLAKAFAEGDVGSLRDTFREAVTKYQYLLWELQDNPPADPADARELTDLLQTIGPQLTVMAPQIRQGYVTVFSATGNPATKGPLYGQVIDRTKDVMAAAQLVNWDTVMTDVFDRQLFGPLPTGGLVWVDVPVGKVEVSVERLSALQPSLAGISLADCVIAVWQGFEGQYTQSGAMVAAERSMPAIYETASRATIAALDDIHARLYGGGITLQCMADEYEPNDTWGMAVASPAGQTAGRDAIRLRDLTLCNPNEGSARNDDWYAFPMGFIAFDATARVRPPEELVMGAGEPLCLEMYYYGQTNELANMPPTLVGGDCGTAGDWFFDVGPVGIRRAAGEAWAFLVIHVYGEGDVPIAYDLSFAL